MYGTLSSHQTADRRPGAWGWRATETPETAPAPRRLCFGAVASMESAIETFFGLPPGRLRKRRMLKTDFRDDCDNRALALLLAH